MSCELISKDSKEVIQKWCYNEKFALKFTNFEEVDVTHNGICRREACNRTKCITVTGKFSSYKPAGDLICCLTLCLR